MGYYYQFKSKEIKLIKDTPKEIVGFLDAFINQEDFDYPTPSHPLFTLKRWSSVLGKWAWYDKPFTFFNKDKLTLFIWCDVNYEREVIIEFVKWITPYVKGHKPKEYIGFIKGEDDREKTNLYIERTGSNIS